MAKVLVVDDESTIRDLLDTVLRRKGHEVLLAEQGSKAMDVYRREHPQIVILDLVMPGVNGMTVLRQLRALDADLPVIVLTGMGDEESEQRARELGVTDFLKKSFSLHQLGQALAKALAQVDARDVPRAPSGHNSGGARSVSG